MGRRTSSSASMNLDSLLDTLTNVVGFLVILMVLLSIDARDAITRIRAKNPEALGVRAEDVENSRQRLASLQRLLASLTSSNAALQATIAAANKSLEEARRGPAPAVAINPDEAKRLAEQRAAELVKVQKKFTDSDKEMARLKALLDRTPVTAPLAAVALAVPDPKPAPTNATPLWFMCHHGRVSLMDEPGLQQTAVRTITGLRRMMESRSASVAPKPAKLDPNLVEYDHAKVEDYFKKNAVGSPHFLLSVRASPDRSSANLVITGRDGAGETVAQLRLPQSTFRNTLRLAAMQKKYIRFVVAPDSFAVYLEARTITDAAGLAAGWEVIGAPQWWTSLPDIRIRVVKAPPPPVPPKPLPPGTPAPVPRKPEPPKVID